MKNKLCFLVRHLSSSSCFLNHRSYYSYLTTTATAPTTKPYFLIPTLPFSTTTPTTTTSTTDTTKPVATYLTQRLGFPEKLSLALSKKLLIREHNHVHVTTDLLFSFEKNSDNVITFLQQHCGLTHSRIKKLITKHPRVLTSDVDETLKPKVKLLQELGFSTSDLAHCLSTDPYWYLETDLTPVVQALRGILGSDDKYVLRVFKGLEYATASSVLNNLVPNVTMLENEYGISKMRVRDFLCSQPLVLMLKAERIRYGIVKVEDKWGITLDSSEFLRAVAVKCSFSDDDINSKCRVFRNYGWSDSDVVSLIRKLPTSLGLSKSMIKQKLGFYMNELGYKPAFVASRPALFSLSLKGRVVPRHKVLLALKEKGLIKEDFRHDIALLLNEDKFIEKFILPYEKTVPELCQVYMHRGSTTSEADVHVETSENGTKTPSAAE